MPDTRRVAQNRFRDVRTDGSTTLVLARNVGGEGDFGLCIILF